MAQPNDLLIIDEPELSLHPSKQRKIARLLAMLVNAGIKVMFTTHSDYMMVEINNLIMMNQLKDSDKDSICKSYNIPKDAILNLNDVAAYYIEKNKDDKTLEKNTNKVSNCETENGVFIFESFDKELIELGNLSDKIRDTL